MSFNNFSTGKSHSFGGTYLELTPHERIRYTDKFDDLRGLALLSDLHHDGDENDQHDDYDGPKTTPSTSELKGSKDGPH